MPFRQMEERKMQSLRGHRNESQGERYWIQWTRPLAVRSCSDQEGYRMEGDFYPNIEPDESRAQLVVPASWSEKEWEILKEIVERAGSQILEIEEISSSWTRIRLRGPDMREVALRLTEKGVFQFRGINALSIERESG